MANCIEGQSFLTFSHRPPPLQADGLYSRGSLLELCSRVPERSPAKGGETLTELVARIQHLKQEHGPLLNKIGRDHGMSQLLKDELLAHLHEEEAEVIQKLAVIAPDVAARFKPGAAASRSVDERRGGPQAPALDRGLTVGSLRDALPAVTNLVASSSVEPRAADLGTVHVVARAPANAAIVARRAGLSIGSLRRR